MESLRRIARSSSSVSTISQAVSSARNVLFLILSARELGADEFGQVAIVTTAAITLNELLRAAASHPLALLFDDCPTQDNDPLERATAFHASLALTIGLGLAVACLAVVRSSAPALIVGAVAYAPVAIFDALRVGSINRGRPGRALALDAAWAALLLPGLFITLRSYSTAPGSLVVWGATAAIVVVAGVASIGLRPQPSAALPYWRDVRSVARSLVVQVSLESVPTRIGALLIAAVVGTAVAGSIRGAEVLLGGASMIYSGVAAASLRDSRQTQVTKGHRAVVQLLSRRFGVVLGVLATNLVIVLLLPNAVGEAILGESWLGASAIAPANALLLAGLIAFAAISVAIRSSLEMGALVRIDLVGALAVLAFVPAIAYFNGAETALAANGLIVWAMFGLGVVQLRRSLRHVG